MGSVSPFTASFPLTSGDELVATCMSHTWPWKRRWQATRKARSAQGHRCLGEIKGKATAGGVDDYGVEMLCTRTSLAGLMAITSQLSALDMQQDEQRTYIEVRLCSSFHLWPSDNLMESPGWRGLSNIRTQGTATRRYQNS